MHQQLITEDVMTIHDIFLQVWVSQDTKILLGAEKVWEPLI